jgi:PAS domain S-box-containing protein
MVNLFCAAERGAKELSSMLERFFRVEDLLDHDGRGQTDQLHQQLREVNQRLVLATLHAHELAEEAEHARGVATLSELRLRTLVNSIAAIVWTADAGGFIRFDASWHVLTGLTQVEPSSQWDWLGGVHPDDRQRVRAAWAAAVDGGTVYECEHRLVTPEGNIAWVQASAVPILGAHGQVREWIGLMADITPRKLVEEARDRFVGVLGHDLRTPLTAIVMAADQLTSEPEMLEPQQIVVVGLIRKCAWRMQRMVVDVLDFARGRLGGGIPISPAPANFGEACRDAVTELRSVHAARRIVLEMSGDLDGVWDVGKVQQAVSNLVGNALEHGVDPVRVSVRSEADDVVLEVNNQNLGPPLPAEILPQLFEPFRRGPARSDSAGLGLGLFIVKEIVRAHGGAIEVTSSEAEGTTFSSRWSRRLPRQLDPPSTTRRPRSRSPSA